MKLIYIQTLKIGTKTEIPYRITIGNDADLSDTISFLIRPEISIPKKVYDAHHLDRMVLLAAPPFCDSADELIDLFEDETLVFSERKQFSIVKSQFKMIGYNFNVHPKILWHAGKNDRGKSLEDFITTDAKIDFYSAEFGNRFMDFMRSLLNVNQEQLQIRKEDEIMRRQFDLSSYKQVPGVYFFLDEFDEVLYVGKAKNVRKRLQSHFSMNSEANAIDYSQIRNINVDYTGNDLIAQLIESDQIKSLKPIYNTQQIHDAAPFIINKGATAKGIHRLKITRKDIQDNMPEKYFNRLSVKQSLEEFCTTYQLCRKHCALESAKGPCTNVTLKHQTCVCASTESVEIYNDRFDSAFFNFQRKKTRKVYKLNGRTSNEDAFIYTVNGIFEGYGFIDKNDTILTEHDLLGNLISMTSNYDTSRIISGLPIKVSPENILVLE